MKNKPGVSDGVFVGIVIAISSILIFFDMSIFMLLVPVAGMLFLAFTYYSHFIRGVFTFTKEFNDLGKSGNSNSSGTQTTYTSNLKSEIREMLYESIADAKTKDLKDLIDKGYSKEAAKAALFLNGWSVEKFNECWAYLNKSEPGDKNE